MERSIEDIKKYRVIVIRNIEFIKDRISIQSQPGYDPIQKITQASERQYYFPDLENEKQKLALANKWLEANGVACDNEPEQVSSGKYTGIDNQFDAWKNREFNKSNSNEKAENSNQTEGYPASKSWEGIHHKTNGPGGQKEKS